MLNIYVKAAIVGSLGVLLWAENAHAYVDPGLVGAFFQVVYFLIFGVALGWLLKPFSWLKQLLGKGSNDSMKPDQSIKADEKFQE